MPSTLTCGRRGRGRWTRLVWVAVLAVVVPLVGGCVVPGRGEEPGRVPAATVAAFPGNGGEAPLLVDAGWLAGRIGGPGVRVLDLSAVATYRRGHVPGAVHVWWQDTMDRFDPVYGVVISEERDPGARAELLAALGIGEGTIVVAYDDERNRHAARLVWLLRYLGHERASVLDGGLAAWRGAGGATEEEGHEAPDVVAAAPDPQSGFLIGTRELRDRLDDPALIILDTRTEEEAADDVNGTLRVGRIPGSVVVPWTATLRDGAGRPKSPEELAALYRGAGVVPDADKRVIVYARFGVEAGHTWWVLKLLGYPHVRVYDAGWAGWAARAELPVEEMGG